MTQVCESRQKGMPFVLRRGRPHELDVLAILVRGAHHLLLVTGDQDEDEVEIANCALMDCVDNLRVHATCP